GEHHAPLNRTAGIPPRIAINFDKRFHLRAEERNCHDAVSFFPREYKALLCRQSRNPEWRPRPLRRARERRGGREAMEPSLVTDVLMFEKTPDSLDSFFEPGAAFIERHTEAAELVRQKGARETDLESALADGVEHADLAS